MISRRALLKGALCLPLALPLTLAEAAPAPSWQTHLLARERTLSLVRASTNESATLCYWRPGRGLDLQGYRKACYLLRDVESKAWAQIDTRLLDALYLIQAWLVANGLPNVIHVLSGYRTPEHNARLKKAGKRSLHMQGRAVDFRIPGLTTKGLAAMALVVGGGVGIYLEGDFVHLDTGGRRNWRG